MKKETAEVPKPGQMASIITKALVSKPSDIANLNWWIDLVKKTTKDKKS